MVWEGWDDCNDCYSTRGSEKERPKQVQYLRKYAGTITNTNGIRQRQRCCRQSTSYIYLAKAAGSSPAGYTTKPVDMQFLDMIAK